MSVSTGDEQQKMAKIPLVRPPIKLDKPLIS